MAKATLPTNYQDDVLKSTMGGKRRYTFTDNSDGTKSLEDATQYDKVGSNFGAADINKTNAAVNAAADASKIMENVDDIAANTQAGYMMGALAGKQLIQNLNGYQFRVNNGIPEYKAGADAAWVPLGSGIYFIADYGELTAYGTSPKTYIIPVPAYVKSRVAASVYNNADNYVGLADTVVGIAPGGVPGNHQHPSILSVDNGTITITVGAKGASYYVQPRGKIYLVTGSIIKA